METNQVLETERLIAEEGEKSGSCFSFACTMDSKSE